MDRREARGIESALRESGWRRPKSFGPFEVRGELGRGAGGVVYVAWDPEHDRTAAVKLFTSAPKDATAAIGRLRRDAQAAGALGHPNIAAVLGVGEHEGRPWVATEFVPGVSLAQVLRSRAPMPIERVLDVWRQLCEGLAHAHREGVFHLDLKPADVRVTPDRRGEDRGLRLVAPQGARAAGAGPAEEGLHYRAPEMLAGRRPDRRADVFSVGAIVYELVSYRKAFPGDSTTDVVRGLTRCEPDLACLPRTPFTPGFERVLAASLARSPRSATPRSRTCTPTSCSSCATPCPACAARPRRRRRARPSARSSSPRVTRARAEDRLEDALEGCRRLLELDPEDEAARRAMSEIESVLLDREVDGLVGMALAYAADGEFTLATGIAEKVERLAPWSPRYLQLQVYLDEEGARRRADGLVATAREHLAAGRDEEARAAARDALAAMPGHLAAARSSSEQLGGAPAGSRPAAEAPGGRRAPRAGARPRRSPPPRRARARPAPEPAPPPGRPKPAPPPGPARRRGRGPERRRAPALRQGRARPGPRGRRAGPGPRPRRTAGPWSSRRSCACSAELRPIIGGR